MSDPFEKARRRGPRAKRQLIEMAGGVLPRDAAAAALGIDPSELDRLAATDKVLWIDEAGRRVFPAVQFRDGAVLPGLAPVIAALPTRSAWVRLAFLLSGNARLAGARPIDALRRGDPGSVLAAARSFLDHGG